MQVGIFLYVMLLLQSNATKCTRELLVKHGFDGSRFTETSFKVPGVTQLLDSGEPLENMMAFWEVETNNNTAPLSKFVRKLSAGCGGAAATDLM